MITVMFYLVGVSILHPCTAAFHHPTSSHQPLFFVLMDRGSSRPGFNFLSVLACQAWTLGKCRFPEGFSFEAVCF
jgi:hypothetical protein